jgi:hypothetical protein
LAVLLGKWVLLIARIRLNSATVFLAELCAIALSYWGLLYTGLTQKKIYIAANTINLQ